MTENRDTTELAKAREQSTRDAIRQGDTEVPLVGRFTFQQLRLEPVVADEWGRLWRVENDRLVRVYTPERRNKEPK